MYNPGNHLAQVVVTLFVYYELAFSSFVGTVFMFPMILANFKKTNTYLEMGGQGYIYSMPSLFFYVGGRIEV